MKSAIITLILLLPSLSASFRPLRYSAAINSHRRGRTPTVFPRRRNLVSLSTAKSPGAELRDRLGLYDRFDRWRFLQRLLDFETDAADTNRILHSVLEGYLQYKRPTYGTTEVTGSPEFTAERRAQIETVLQDSSSGMLPALSDGGPPHNQAVLDKLEKLLPDPDEDEDDFKGLWDTIIELNGRESVKINERDATPDWKATCLVGRVLVHFDFLTYGILDEPIRS